MRVSYNNTLARCAMLRALACSAAKARADRACQPRLADDLQLGAVVALAAFAAFLLVLP